jgi:hypothetical protein
VVKYRISRPVVERKMQLLMINYKELAGRLEVSQSQMNYIMTRGGKRYALPLAKALHCRPAELIMVKGE